MFRSTLRRLAEAQKLTIFNNPYKAHKQWPPDFSKLSPKDQFRFERRYRRRAKLRYLPPEWVRKVKFTATGTCSAILVYMVLFMDWGEMPGLETKPFEDLRGWIRTQISSIWTVNSTTPTKPATEDSTQKT